MNKVYACGVFLVLRAWFLVGSLKAMFLVGSPAACSWFFVLGEEKEKGVT